MRTRHAGDCEPIGGTITRALARLPLDIARIETRAALKSDAAPAAYLVHIARLRHLRRPPSAASARAAGW
jgi:hypothetical protein